jgi:signal transduction histidine kinase/DNA-binding response OmpR family regulator
MVFTTACQSEADNIPTETKLFKTYRDIPGVTAQEISAIEELRQTVLQKENGSLVYGMMLSTETFINENNEVDGYTALVCRWLTELFGIPFKPAIYDWGDILQGLQTYEIDFCGEFTPTEERRKNWFMTDSISERSLKYMRIADSIPLSSIQKSRLPRYVFLDGSIAAIGAAALADHSFETVLVNDYATVYAMLKSGECDAFIEDGFTEAAFDIYGDVVTEDFFPLIFNTIAMTMCNLALQPIISVVTKALRSGAMPYLNKLYNQGYEAYRRHKFFMLLNDEEKTYLRNTTSVPMVYQYFNYPVAFYDFHHKKWDGISLDILHEVEKLTGFTFDVINDEHTEMPELIAMLSDGKAHIFCDLIYSTQRAPHFIWNKNKFMADQYALLSKINYPNVNINEIPYNRISLIRSTAHEEMFRTWFPGALYATQYPNSDDAFLALEQDKVDLVMVSKGKLLWYSNYYEFSGYKANFLFNYFYESGFAFNKDQTVLCSIVDKAVSVIDTTMITEQWITKTYDFRSRLLAARLPWLIGAVTLSFAILCLVLILLYRNRRNEKRLENLVAEASEARELAEKNSYYKSNFLATVSHEIRTPMNAIMGISEIQLQKGNLLPEMDEAFSKIYESGDILLDIINDILDLSKIEAGKLELAPFEYDLLSMINDTAQVNTLRYEGKPIQLIINVDENAPLELFGDEFRIKQVLNNILSNAFKYTNNGKIEFFVSSEPVDAEDGHVILVFRVVDTGQGMTEDQVNKLFDEYTRFNAEANRTTVGVGLGMSIAKRLIDLMSGEIFVESEPGKGSVFIVRLPQKKTGPAVCGPESVEKLRNFSFHSTEILKKTQSMREFMPYGSVLVVDDVESNLFVIKSMLDLYGIKTETVTSGFDAIEKVKNGKVYDIVFMDHMMPKMDGIEAVKIMREMGYTNSIVALTANALIGRKKMFLQNGFDGFTSKPIDSRELNLILNEFIRNKKPPEVVETARKEQQEKNLKNKEPQQKPPNKSDVEKFFIRDAKNAVNVLESLAAKIHDPGEEEIRLYTITVHGMKSALANIGEKELSGIALKLEQAGRDRNTKVMSAETPAFIKALQSLIEKLKPVEENKGLKNSNEDLSFLHDKLLKLKAACMAFDNDGVETILYDLWQKKWPNHIKAVFDDISMYMLHSDFDKAAETADNAVKNFASPT